MKLKLEAMIMVEYKELRIRRVKKNTLAQLRIYNTRSMKNENITLSPWGL